MTITTREQTATSAVKGKSVVNEFSLRRIRGLNRIVGCHHFPRSLCVRDRGPFPANKSSKKEDIRQNRINSHERPPTGMVGSGQGTTAPETVCQKVSDSDTLVVPYKDDLMRNGTKMT